MTFPKIIHERRQLVASIRTINYDVQFLIGSFFLMTALAFYFGIRSSVRYSLEGVPVYWFHLSYHYLASAWSWILILPGLIDFRRQFKSTNRYVTLALLAAIPIALLHRFLALFSDQTFRWLMGYTSTDPIEAFSSLTPPFYHRCF